MPIFQTIRIYLDIACRAPRGTFDKDPTPEVWDLIEPHCPLPCEGYAGLGERCDNCDYGTILDTTIEHDALENLDYHVARNNITQAEADAIALTRDGVIEV